MQKDSPVRLAVLGDTYHFHSNIPEFEVSVSGKDYNKAWKTFGHQVNEAITNYALEHGAPTENMNKLWSEIERLKQENNIVIKDGKFFIKQYGVLIEIDQTGFK